MLPQDSLLAFSTCFTKPPIQICSSEYHLQANSEPYPELMLLIEPLLPRLELLLSPILGHQLDLVLQQLHLLLKALPESLQILLLLCADLFRCHLKKKMLRIQLIKLFY